MRGALAPVEGRHEAVHTGHRRAAPPRQLAGRDRDCPRPRDGQGPVAGADGRRRRVLASRRRRHRLLRSDGRTPVRGQLPQPHPLGVRYGRQNLREPVRLGSPRLHLELRGRDQPRPDVRTRLWTTVRQSATPSHWESFYAGRRRTANASTASPDRGASWRSTPPTARPLGPLGSAASATRRPRSRMAACSSAASTAGCAHIARRTEPSSGPRTDPGGKILGAPFVAGNHVFFSALDKRTFAVRTTDGELAVADLDGPLLQITTERVLPLAERPRDRDPRPDYPPA